MSQLNSNPNHLSEQEYVAACFRSNSNLREKEDTLLLPTQAEERKDDASVKYRICSVPFAPLRMLHDRNPVLGTNSFIKPIRFWWITVLYYVLERIKCYIIHRFGLVALG
ncbi:hypothetical protein Y032_0100g3259 [Ancylostoma ceylanicum]|uniref:Uncharacterized protein n=1 Tax=Ancylostoma ceylanicum TaxID=53326 RepID=A0A016TI86_9BILA|nr:hypothetical protein Y032_0100g3259 [Ancylostoma ceylanicum]